MWCSRVAMGGPSAVACSYRRPQEPSSPTTNYPNTRQKKEKNNKSVSKNQIKPQMYLNIVVYWSFFYLQSFVKPAVPTVRESPASVQNLRCFTAGVSVNQTGREFTELNCVFFPTFSVASLSHETHERDIDDSVSEFWTRPRYFMRQV